jgi:hypothetical protein
VKLYRIRDWDRHFENNRTRELKRLDWVPVPNKHDGDGFTELLDHPNGMAHYAAWHLILQVASKCNPRGTLARDTIGTIPQDGAGDCQTPHTPQSLARITRGDEKAFSEAIPRLVSIGWLEACGESRHNPAPNCGKVPMEGNGREGNGIEEKAPKRALTDAWVSAYQQVNKRPYLFQGAKDGRAADTLLKLGLPVDEIIGIAKAAWNNSEGFNCKQAASLAGFASRFNDIQQELKGPAKLPNFALGPSTNGRRPF